MSLLSVLQSSPAQRLVRALRCAGIAAAATALVACGGGGGGDVADPGAPATPAGLSLGPAGVKTLNFKWDAVAGATHYKLFEDLDGAATAASPVEVNVASGGLGGGMITGVSYGHEVPLYERLNATYTLRACNALGCSASSPAFQPSIANLNAAIGYAKAAGGGVAGDTYGAAIAVSRDGNTLAVGAPNDDDGATLDAGAVYVMRRTAAGVWTAPQMLLDGNPATNENFGRSLALSADGRVLAVGIPNGTAGGSAIGLVRMFVFSTGTQAYAAQDSVSAPISADGNQFGWSVALSDDGNVLVVGAPQEDSAAGIGGAFIIGDFSQTNAGAVFVYAYNGVDEWAHQQSLKASNAQANDRFGHSIALSGDGLTLAVGARGEDSDSVLIDTDPSSPGLASEAADGAGAVYVFSRAAVGVNFTNQVYIKASNTGAGDNFGWSVALSQNGSVLAVGAINESSSATGVNGDQANNGTFSSGAVYVFTRAGTVWAQQSYLKASNTSILAYFGNTVALSSDGNTLAIGASADKRPGVGMNADPLTPIVPAQDRGAVYLFQRSATGTWAQSAYLKSPTAPADLSSRGFGSALALSGDGSSLAVGDPYEGNSQAPTPNPTAGAPALDDNAATQSGAVYMF